MSSESLQSIVESIKLNDYISLVIITAVIYDYSLTLSREIDYVWSRPWTRVSTMFVLVRYVGLCWAILTGLVGSTFVTGPLLMCTTLTLMMCWGFPIFLAAADLVMILRVHAMWNQSKWILSALLFIYVPQVILSFVFSGIYYNPNTFLSVTIAHVIDFSFCAGSSIPTPLQLGLSIPRFILATVLLVFAIIPTLTQSVEMYTVTKVWQPSKIMQKLVKDGIVYFLVNMLYNTHDIIVNGSTLNATSVLFLGMFSCVAICPIMPRFIISIRELHDRERRGNWMDTGFNLLSQLASEDATVCASQIANGAEDDPEATRLDILGDNTQQV